MASFLDKVIKWFRGPTDEDMYESGRMTVDRALSPSVDLFVVDHLFALSHGGFNETPGQNSYDKGVQDRLHELGFKSPY